MVCPCQHPGEQNRETGIKIHLSAGVDLGGVSDQLSINADGFHQRAAISESLREVHVTAGERLKDFPVVPILCLKFLTYFDGPVVIPNCLRLFSCPVLNITKVAVGKQEIQTRLWLYS